MIRNLSFWVILGSWLAGVASVAAVAAAASAAVAVAVVAAAGWEALGRGS